MKWEKKVTKRQNVKRKKKCMNEPFESIGRRAILTVTCNFRYSCYKCCCRCVPFWCWLFLWQWNNCYILYGYNKWQQEKKKNKRIQFFILLKWSDGIHLVHLCYLILYTIFISLSLSLFFITLFHAFDLSRQKYHIVAMEKLSLHYLRPLSDHDMHTYCIWSFYSSLWMQKWRSRLTNKTRKNTNVANMHQAAQKEKKCCDNAIAINALSWTVKETSWSDSILFFFASGMFKLQHIW